MPTSSRCRYLQNFFKLWPELSAQQASTQYPSSGSRILPGWASKLRPGVQTMLTHYALSPPQHTPSQTAHSTAQGWFRKSSLGVLRSTQFTFRRGNDPGGRIRGQLSFLTPGWGSQQGPPVLRHHSVNSCPTERQCKLLMSF